jgi:hypothetical protein
MQHNMYMSDNASQRVHESATPVRTSCWIVRCSCSICSGLTRHAEELQTNRAVLNLALLHCCLLQVPPEALLDIDLPDEEEQQAGSSSNGSGHAASVSVQGEVGFLSHEPVVAGTRSRQRKQPGERYIGVYEALLCWR